MVRTIQMSEIGTMNLTRRLDTSAHHVSSALNRWLDMALKLGDKYPAPKLAVRARTDSFNLELEVVGGQ